MRVELKFSTTWTEYEAEKGIQITDVLHKGLDPADNEARVTFVQNITLYNLFRGMTPGQKVPARIYDDAEALVFFGYIARSFSVTKKQRLQPIEVQLVSPTNYLKSKIPETLAYTAIRVSAASAAIPSLVRHVLNAAGYVDADIVIPDITATIPAVVIEENTQTYFDVVKNALKEYCYILDFDETGKTKYYELFPASVTSTHTFDGSNIRVSVVQSIRPEEYDAVHVQYPEVETVTGTLLFKDTTDPAGLNDCTVNIDPSSYLNGEEFWYAEYSSDRGEILAASGAALDIIKDAEISVLSFSGLAKRAKLSIRNTSATFVRTIRRLRITGSAVVQTGVSVVKRAKTTETEKVFEFDTQYIFAKADAENLANKLASYFDTSDFTYALGSEDRVAIGAIVTVAETGIGSNLCRVTERQFDGKIGLYTYKLEAIANYVAPPVSSSDRYVYNTPESAGTIDALTDEIAARPTSTTLSTAPATPASLVALAVQDGITLLASPGGSPGLDNSAAYYHYQVSRDGGLTWPGDWTAAAQAEFRFDRDSDGYPDSMSLYQARVKAVSAAGVESVAWLTVAVDGTGYAGWTPGTPVLSGAADNRTAELRMVQGGSYYGHSRFEVQIQRGDDGADWYAPGDSAAARSSETAYRGALDGYASAYADTFAQTLPLINQAAGLPENTSYLYRIRAVVAKPTTAAPDAVARSSWTAAVTVVAKPTGTVDLVEKAVKHAQLDDDAVWLNNLNVLAKNLVNDLTSDADGTTGWTGHFPVATFDRILDTTLDPDYKVGRISSGGAARAWTDAFTVGPNDIIELEYMLRAPGTATTGEACVGYSGSGEYYEISTWDATAKAWGAFGGNNDVVQFNVSSATLNTSYKRLLSYVVGINVQPDAIPAPANGLTSTTYCARVKNGVARMSIVNRAGTGDLYIFAPSARKVGTGKIVAQQIVTPNLAAISAKLGEIQGDTADYKLVMGSGGSAEEGTLLLGATTDASYFRRWKEGGVWKMAIKLATLFVDAVSSKILGIFRVRNSADTSTVFEVDPTTGKMDHDGGRLYRFRAFNTTAGMYWLRVCKIGMNAVGGNNRFHIRITGKVGWNGTNAPGHIDIDGSTNFYTSSYTNLCGVGGIARHFQGNSAQTLTGKIADDTPVDICSSVYFVQQPGYNRQEVDVYLRWDTAQQYLSYLIEVVLDYASGESVTKHGTFTATDPTTGATDYYKLPMRRVIEETPSGATPMRWAYVSENLTVAKGINGLMVKGNHATTAAVATGTNATAIGPGASATNENDIVIGPGASATHKNSVVIGPGASSEAEYAVAVGYNADADAVDAIAIGRSNALHPDSVMIGSYTSTMDGEVRVGLVNALIFPIGTTQGAIYTAITSRLGTSSVRSYGCLGSYGYNEVLTVRVDSPTAIGFSGDGGVGRLACTKGSTETITLELKVMILVG